MNKPIAGRRRRGGFLPRPPERMEARALMATLTVNSIADAVLPDGGLTLREAILVSDGDRPLSDLSAQEIAQVSGPLSTSTPNTIAFDLPGSGVRTIFPLTPLPAITKPLVIDGYTQAGSHPNTLDVGSNAGILVSLDGSMSSSASDGLEIQAANSTVRGLAIGNFVSEGVALGGDGDAILGSFVGADVAGLIAKPNGEGVYVDAAHVSIGSPAAADRDVISGNSTSGLILDGATGSVVQGDLIGTDATAAGGLGNGGDGVFIEHPSTSGVLGGDAAGAENRIAFNRLAGILVHGTFTVLPGPPPVGYTPGPPDSPTGQVMSGNLIYANGGPELVYDDSTPTPRTATPVVTQARPDHVDGTVQADPNATVHVEIFATMAGSIVPEAAGSADAVADPSGRATFHVVTTSALPVGATVKAIATETSPTIASTSPYTTGTMVFDHTVRDIGVVGTPIPTTQAGNSATYLFTVTNNGSDLDSGGTLTVTLPLMTRFVASSYDPESYTPPSGTDPAQLVLVVGDLAPGALKLFTILTNPIKAGNLTATAVLTQSSPDDNPANDSASLTAQVVGVSDLSAALVLRTPDGRVGQPIVYGLRVINAGPDGAFPLRLTGILLRNADGSPAPGASQIMSVKVDGTPFPFAGDGADLIDMGVGAVTLTIELVPLVAGDFLFNPTVSSVGTDPTPADATLSVPAHVLPALDLTGPIAFAPQVAFSRKGRGTAITIGFDEAIDAASATSLGSYALVLPGRDRRFNTRDDRGVRISGVVYNPATHIVTLTTRTRLSPALTYQLSLSRIKDTTGIALAGGVERFQFGKAPRRLKQG